MPLVLPFRRHASRGSHASLIALCTLVCLSGSTVSAWCALPAAPEAAHLKRLASAPRDPDLRWSDTSDVRAEVARLYAAQDWAPLWLEGAHPTLAATQLLARLAAADSLGLAPADYDAAWLARACRVMASPTRSATALECARFDVAMTVAALRFVGALHRGRVSPRLAHAELFLPRPSLSVERAVDSLRDDAHQGAVLAEIQPQLSHYQLLKNGLARYRELARDTTLAPLRGMPRVVRPHARLAAASALRQLLVAIGDLDPGASDGAVADTLYADDLVAAVKRFQLRQGYAADGIIGPATVARLNRPFAQRVRQIELALERFRWLPPSFTAPPIIVNIPAFRLYAFREPGDRESDMLSMDVVVGDAFDTRTPVFAASMRYLIFRPYWEVPVSIMRGELGPRALRNPAFLRRERMVLVKGDADDAPVLPPTAANLARIGRGLRVRQLPGERNALGLVKFMLPNSHDIYLHDSPAKGLFASTRRDFSHGCIRLKDPIALAVQVLRDQPEWTPEHIRDAMASGDNVRVNLLHPIPVYILYTTVVPRENGEVYFYNDLYGLDAELEAMLDRGYPYPR